MEKPCSAYAGTDRYVFVCYAHKDAGVVYPEIAWLHDEGINIWYDEGISPGDNWRASIGNALLGATSVIVYLSPHSLASHHCNREINLALDEGKPIIPVYLEATELSPDLRIGFARIQALQADAAGGHRPALLRAIGAGTTVHAIQGTPHKPSRTPLSWLFGGLALAASFAALWLFAGPEQTAEDPAYNLYQRSFAAHDLPERIELLEKALEFDPDFLDARAHLGNSLISAAEGGDILDLQAFQRARDEALIVLANDPEHPLANVIMARTYLQLDRNAPKALEAFERAEAYGADVGVIAIFKAAIYLNTGKYDLAEDTMRAAYERFPDSVWVAEFYARCLYMQGKVDAAWSMFDEALRLDPRVKNAVINSLLMAAVEGDTSRMRALLEVIPADAVVQHYGEPLIETLEGDPGPLREFLTFTEQSRVQSSYNAVAFTEGYWWTGDYEKHIAWWKIREVENATLYFTNLQIALKPGYWQKLTAWASSEPDQMELRTRLLREHKSRIQRVTAKMVL